MKVRKKRKKPAARKAKYVDTAPVWALRLPAPAAFVPDPSMSTSESIAASIRRRKISASHSPLPAPSSILLSSLNSRSRASELEAKRTRATAARTPPSTTRRSKLAQYPAKALVGCITSPSMSPGRPHQSAAAATKLLVTDGFFPRKLPRTTINLPRYHSRTEGSTD